MIDTIVKILALWGALLSTVLAVLKIHEFFSRRVRQLHITASTEPPFKKLEISIVNYGACPVTIKEVSVIYGFSAEYGQIVKKIKERPPVKLEKTDPWDASIDREDLITAVRRNSVKQFYRQNIWVEVRTTVGRALAVRLKVPPSIIEKEHNPAAAQWIASDLFLGFPQMKSEEINYQSPPPPVYPPKN